MREGQVVIHIIDDNDVLQERLAASLRAADPTRTFPSIKTWSSVKCLSESWAAGEEHPRADDIAICDLFDIGHYDDDTPGETQHEYKQVRSQPESVENIKRASLDNIAVFFPSLVEHELRILVFSHVIPLLEATNDLDGVSEVRNALAALGIDKGKIFTKRKPREVDPLDLQPVTDHIVEMLRE